MGVIAANSVLEALLGIKTVEFIAYRLKLLHRSLEVLIGRNIG